MAVLAARIGKHSAHDAVYAAAMAARDAGTDLGEQLVAEGLLTKEEVAAATDPAAALGRGGAFVDRVVARPREACCRPAADPAGHPPHPAAARAAAVGGRRRRDLAQARRPHRPRAGRQQGPRAGVPARRRARPRLRQPGHRRRPGLELGDARRARRPHARARHRARLLRRPGAAGGQHAAGDDDRRRDPVHRRRRPRLGRQRGRRGGRRAARRGPHALPDGPRRRDGGRRARLPRRQPGAGRPARRRGRGADRHLAGHRLVRHPGRAGAGRGVAAARARWSA